MLGAEDKNKDERIKEPEKLKIFSNTSYLIMSLCFSDYVVAFSGA